MICAGTSKDRQNVPPVTAKMTSSPHYYYNWSCHIGYSATAHWYGNHRMSSTSLPYIASDWWQTAYGRTKKWIC